MSAKTQILITDIPKDKFTTKWPSTLENELFEVKFPNFKAKLQYFTPLGFLSRIVIILDDEETTNVIYDYLKTQKDIINDSSIKLFATETLIKTRSKSSSVVDNLSSQFDPKSKPILSLDTNPSHTGVDSNSLLLGSPTLSPDKTCLESPTLLKFSDEDSKLHYYKEPLPKSNSTLSLNGNSQEGLDNTSDSDSPTPQSPYITVNEYSG